MVTLNKPSAGDTDWTTDINDNWTNLETSVNGVFRVVKTADQEVTNSTTFQDDNTLQFSVGANETWQFEAVLFIEIATATPDMKLGFMGPTSPSNFRVHVQGWNRDGNDLAANGETLTAYISAADPTTYWEENYGDTVKSMIVARGSIINGSNSGTLSIQWAQRASNSTPTIVKKGSYLVAHRV